MTEEQYEQFATFLSGPVNPELAEAFAEKYTSAELVEAFDRYACEGGVEEVVDNQ